ncbi:MAG: radical SAM protein [Bacteroidota bacterium]
MEKYPAFQTVRGWHFKWIQLRMFVNIWRVGLQLYGNPLKAWKGLQALKAHGDHVLLGRKLVKGFKVGHQYGWDMFHPLWPSPAFDKFFYHHLEEVLPSGQPNGVMRRLLVAITKKCPLQCAHCSEWDTLNQQDVLSKMELKDKINDLLAYGMSQIVYSGGEPLNRYADLLYLVKEFSGRTSQWIYSSGYGLTVEKAFQLKAAGLEGVAISLDHHEAAQHNAFRGNHKSYAWVQASIQNAQQAGLLVSVNVCPTKEYIQEARFDQFMELMKSWEVPVVNILEPRAVGHFAGQDVELNQAEKDYLADHFYRYNFDADYDPYPILTYPALARKFLPCGGGVSYLLLDYDGTLRPCPFCKTPMELPKPDPKAIKARCEA